jgi:hypothetical protein
MMLPFFPGSAVPAESCGRKMTTSIAMPASRVTQARPARKDAIRTPTIAAIEP